MSQKFMGVQNASGGKVKVGYAGEFTVFQKDEIMVLPEPVARHFLSRATYATKVIDTGEGEEGKKRYIERKQLFKEIPLAEALKHVKEPENKSIADAKKAAELEERKEQEMENRVILRLRKAGWAPPSEQKPEQKHQGKVNL